MFKYIYFFFENFKEIPMGCVNNVPSVSKEKKQTKEITRNNETKKQTTGKSYIYMLLQYTLSDYLI